MNEKLLASVRFYFAQSVFNSRCHFIAMDRLGKKEKRLSIFIGIVSAITIISLVLQIFGLEKNYQKIINIATSIGLLTTAVSLIFEMFNKDDRIKEIFQHKIYAEKYKTLRDEYMSLIEEIMSNSTSEDKLRNKRDKFQNHYSSIGEFAPSIEIIDYEQARIGLGISKYNKEEFTWSDPEIDKFLPKQLHIS
jgi:predicted tellurium resistance membrane protein TerC